MGPGAGGGDEALLEHLGVPRRPAHDVVVKLRGDPALGLQPLEWLLLEARAVRTGAPGPAGEHWGFRDPETGGRPTAGAPWAEQRCQRQCLAVWPAGGGWMGGTGSRPWQQWHCKTTGLSSVTSAFCSTGRFTLLGGRAARPFQVACHALPAARVKCALPRSPAG